MIGPSGFVVLMGGALVAARQRSLQSAPDRPGPDGAPAALGSGETDLTPIRVLEISHSSVVSAWRQRDRELVRRGLTLELVTAAAWVEGGVLVRFDAAGDDFAQPARTWGHHPNVFAFDPRPLWRLLAERWDVIHVHEEPCSLAAAEVLVLRLLRGSRAPLILYSAQNIDKRYPPPFRWIERASLRRAAAVSICNQAAGRILRAKGLRGQLAEIPLGVDIGRYRSAERPAPDGRLRIGFVGRLAEHKGVGVLLESVAERPAWTVELVGGGPAEADLRRQAAAAGISDRVVFAGALDEAKVPARYRDFDVVAVPSLPTPAWEEQFCRVAVEAMASGVPVVASRSGALPEVVGDAGVLVPPGDAAALRGALERLGTDPGHWRQCRDAGLARARRYSWSAVADSYDHLYRALAGA